MSSPSSTAREQAILDALRRLVRALREGSRLAEQSVGISGAQLFVLHQLRAGKALSINELAARALTHQSSVSVVVSRLDEAGLVRRTVAADDARRAMVTITRKGKGLLERAPAVEQMRLIEGLRKMRPGDRAALDIGLAAWIAAMALGDEDASMFFEDAPKASKASKASKKGRRRA